MNPFTALAFAVLALLLTGPVPALLARATWPHRAPGAALVLWQAVAIAAVLSAFSSGLAIATELLVPGPDGRPTTAPLEEIDALGLPLWIAYVVVFAITLLIGAKLIFSIASVAVRTRRRWATTRRPPGSAIPSRRAQRADRAGRRARRAAGSRSPDGASRAWLPAPAREPARDRSPEASRAARPAP